MRILTLVPKSLHRFSSWADVRAEEYEYRFDFSDSFLRNITSLSMLPQFLKNFQQKRCYICTPANRVRLPQNDALPAFEITAEDGALAFETASQFYKSNPSNDYTTLLASGDFGIFSPEREWFVFAGLCDERAVFTCKEQWEYDHFVCLLWPRYLDWLRSLGGYATVT